MYIEILDERNFIWWRIKSINGQVLATSEGYSSYRKAHQTAFRVSQRTGLELRIRVTATKTKKIPAAKKRRRKS